MLAGAESDVVQPVLRKLNALRRLSEQGVVRIRAAARQNILKAAAGEDLVCEGDRAESVRLFLSGWAARYKMLEDGRRQIVSFILPGDTCDPHIYLFSKLDDSISTLTPVVYCELDREAFERLVASDRSIAEAFYCETLAASSILREWAINLGRRDALERVAHLICELYSRLRLVGLADENVFAFPVTQMDMADATGLSTVHLNRTLQELRGSELITLKDRNLRIHDFQALSGTAMFNPNYLHLDRK